MVRNGIFWTIGGYLYMFYYPIIPSQWIKFLLLACELVTWLFPVEPMDHLEFCFRNTLVPQLQYSLINCYIVWRCVHMPLYNYFLVLFFFPSIDKFQFRISYRKFSVQFILYLHLSLQKYFPPVSSYRYTLFLMPKLSFICQLYSHSLPEF